jgi:Glycosyl transferase family 2
MTPTAPLVSIIIPCFNPGRMLTRCLRSLSMLDWPNLEVIFVDNNSTDDSRAQAEAFARNFKGRFTVTECPAQGVNHARVHGYGLAGGDFIQWLDADDELHPDKLTRQVAALETSGADVVHGDWIERRVRDDGRVDLIERRAGPHPDPLIRAVLGPWIPPHAFLFRRTAADRLQAEEAWLPARPVTTDLEYMAFAAVLGLEMHYQPGLVATYNEHPGPRISTTTDYAVRVANIRRICARIEERAAAPGAIRLSPRQKALLRPIADAVSAPTGSYSLARTAGRLWRLVHAPTGKAITLKPREAAIAAALLGGGPRIPLHHARALARQRPDLEGGAALILETVEQLYRAGVLLVEPIEPKDAP